MTSTRRFLAAATLCALCCQPAAAQQATGSAGGQSSAAAVPPSGIGRWVDLQQANVSVRYRYIETSVREVTSTEAQNNIALRARFIFDPSARLTLNVGAATGGSLTSGWNSTGIGSGEFAGTFSVKQLFLAAQPVRGVHLEYGSFAGLRGETTEVVNLDNDAYLVGERVSVRRPQSLWFDELSVTFAYLGDPAKPNAFARLNRLATVNYRQYLVGKQLGGRIRVSAEYDRYLAVGTLRAGASLRVPELRIVDRLRFEQYHRFGSSPADGFGLAGEKTVGAVGVVAGITDIDALNQMPNGDRYGRGRRLYSLTTLNLTRDFSVAVYLTRSFGTDFPIANRFRGEVVVGCNALRLGRRALHLN